MDHYDFAVLKDEASVVVARGVPLHSSKAAWPRVAAIARAVHAPGSSIRVTDQSGDMIILIGVVAARRIPLDMAC